MTSDMWSQRAYTHGKFGQISVASAEIFKKGAHLRKLFPVTRSKNLVWDLNTKRLKKENLASCKIAPSTDVHATSGQAIYVSPKQNNYLWDWYDASNVVWIKGLYAWIRQEFARTDKDKIDLWLWDCLQCAWFESLSSARHITRWVNAHNSNSDNVVHY